MLRLAIVLLVTGCTTAVPPVRGDIDAAAAYMKEVCQTPIASRPERVRELNERTRPAYVNVYCD